MYYNIKQSGKYIRQLRARSGYTQEELAQKLNIDRSFLSHIESGKKGCSVDLLVELSTIFNVSMDWLVMGREFYDLSMAGSKERIKEGITILIEHLETFKESL